MDSWDIIEKRKEKGEMQNKILVTVEGFEWTCLRFIASYHDWDVSYVPFMMPYVRWKAAYVRFMRPYVRFIEPYVCWMASYVCWNASYVCWKGSYGEVLSTICISSSVKP